MYAARGTRRAEAQGFLGGGPRLNLGAERVKGGQEEGPWAMGM
jgi:hypothetical protein